MFRALFGLMALAASCVVTGTAAAADFGRGYGIDEVVLEGSEIRVG